MDPAVVSGSPALGSGPSQHRASTEHVRNNKAQGLAPRLRESKISRRVAENLRDRPRVFSDKPECTQREKRLVNAGKSTMNTLLKDHENVAKDLESAGAFGFPDRFH